MPSDIELMRTALQLARLGLGRTSPNPMVGALLVKRGKIIGRGWHHQAGLPHAEIEALRDTQKRRHDPRGATMYVTLEPCSTHGRTPPCTNALIAAGVRRVISGATDPNPKHSGQGYTLLRRAGIKVKEGVLAEESAALNEAFNHWIKNRTPLVTVKAAMTLDGKIATRSGESKWITGETARTWAMNLRQSADAILVGINTILADNPQLTLRPSHTGRTPPNRKPLRRIVLDCEARTPLSSKVVSDRFAKLTTIVVGPDSPPKRRKALSKRIQVLVAPARAGRIDLHWLLKRLGSEDVTNLLVEGGGEVNASFLLGGLAQRIAFFYAPKVLGGVGDRKAVAGLAAKGLEDSLDLHEVQWHKLGEDCLLTARVAAQLKSKLKT